MADIVLDTSNLFIPKYEPILDDILEHKHTHYKFYGGRGSTKSSFISQCIPLLLMENPNIHAAVFRKVGNTIKTSVFGQVEWAIDSLNLTEWFDFKQNPPEITFKPTGQKIMFFGLDDPGKVKSIKLPFGYIGITWFEEEDQFSGPEQIRKVLQSTMRGGSIFWDFRSFNPPISQNNWANEDILESIALRESDTLCFKTSYHDVPVEWLGQAFFDEAEYLKQTNYNAYLHEYEGEAIGTGGSVFDNAVLLEMPDSLVNSFDWVYMGIDWGWYPDPFHWSKMYYNAAKHDLYIFDEYRVNKTSNYDVWQQLKEKKHVTGQDLITADSAEEKSVADLRTYGAYIRAAEKGPGSVEYSMKWLQSLAHIYIDPKRCPETAWEFTHYEYERDKDDNIISGYPDANNHAIDSVRYALERIWKKKGQ